MTGGREASRARRQALSAGKAALPPATERSGGGRRGVPLAAGTVVQAAESAPVPVPAAPAQPAAAPAPGAGSDVSARAVARARRAEISRHGRGDAAPAAPTRPPRRGTLEYAPRVVVSETQGGQRVSGLRVGASSNVTGHARGAGQPVSGSQYIGADAGASWRAGGPKVGLARTPGGTLVSGTLVRSNVRVTGDEAGHGIAITGEADQQPGDDLTPRASSAASAGAQFARQAAPHGASVFGTSLGRSAPSAGSRERSLAYPIESTLGGQAVTGSALGRSARVTGDEAGACRRVTGDQYLAPAERQAECGGRFGGTAPAAQLGASRRDPVTGAKVRVAQTWGAQRVTGIDVEHDPRVTGDAPGSCSVITGSPYQGAQTIYGFCDDGTAAAAEARLPRRSGFAAVTGDTPRHDAGVTGTARGAARDVTGTPYYAPEHAVEVLAEPVARLDERFSVRSPQRSAHLRAEADGAAPGGGRITGSFAVGGDKVTGNLEFAFRPRRSAGPAEPAHARISGEGRSTGRRITGDAWAASPRVGGTEGAIAADRNPSRRGSVNGTGGAPKPFAGAGRFKALAPDEEPKRLVTGMTGYASDAGAKVTLSGGAQG
jgi:hypothetical protein